MRLVIQRVREASVLMTESGERQSIGQGLAVLVGFGQEDTRPGAWEAALASFEKMLVLRIFPDDEQRMNKSLLDCGGELLLVSQFTLYADCRKGRRPSFHLACPPQEAESLFTRFCAMAAERLPGKVRTGVFGAHMDVSLINWGPVTILFDSTEAAAKL